MKRTKQQIEKSSYLQREASSPKSDLMRVASRMEENNPKLANSLWSIIAKLEAWQHKSP